jgi:hypothetical protein
LAWLLLLYYAIKMSGDLTEAARAKSGPGFPVFVADDDLESDDGRRWRDLMQRWLAVFVLSGLAGMLLIYFYHRG